MARSSRRLCGLGRHIRRGESRWRARIARPFIRKAFDKAPPTLLDWKGELALRCGFEPNVPNIYVFDRHGELHGALSGPGSALELAALRELLERL
ncbi:MAG TPA: hypothetical protein VM616_06505 [Gammaproteobacteria bacterium]|nr:hypothetical protein [Gammaproteobacteria bacterium]